MHICTDIYTNLLYYIFQHLYVHCNFSTGKDFVALCICCQEALHLLLHIFAIISSPGLKIAITLHCYFCEIFGKLFVHLPSSMNGELGLAKPQGPYIMSLVTI